MGLEKSRSLFREARKRIPGGVNSPVRAFGSVGGVPSPQDPRELAANRGEERVRAPVTATKEPSDGPAA